MYKISPPKKFKKSKNLHFGLLRFSVFKKAQKPSFFLINFPVVVPHEVAWCTRQLPCAVWTPTIPCVMRCTGGTRGKLAGALSAHHCHEYV